MTRVVRIDPQRPDLERLREAAAVLRDGGLVAFPTETVYGLGAHALNATAVARIFEAKGRPAIDPLIVHLASVDQLEAVAHAVPHVARELAAAFWPGALTLILEKHSIVPEAVTAGLRTVGVRVPSHPIAHELIAMAAVPVAAPSANRFSRPSPTCVEHVLADLDGVVDVVIDGGPTPIGLESTILDLTVAPPLVRRPGGVSLAEIRRIVPDAQSGSALADRDRAQPSPGQLLRHYAPRATLTLYIGAVAMVTERMANDIRRAVASGVRVGVLAPEEDLLALAPRLAAVGAGGRVVTMRCGTRRDRDEAARDLFRTLRALDAEGVDVMFASAPAGEGIDAAIIDRLTRAAEGRVVHT
ncbi:MAG TPA: L-threonylcarbamoyladenylate synthase [Vicinamibacterales bacterium]|nr:L-threonylcarbamoyladenylate synthase [Vicinamibacterales bacterium]